MALLPAQLILTIKILQISVHRSQTAFFPTPRLPRPCKTKCSSCLGSLHRTAADYTFAVRDECEPQVVVHFYLNVRICKNGIFFELVAELHIDYFPRNHQRYLNAFVCFPNHALCPFGRCYGRDCENVFSAFSISSVTVFCLLSATTSVFTMREFASTPSSLWGYSGRALKSCACQKCASQAQKAVASSFYSAGQEFFQFGKIIFAVLILDDKAALHQFVHRSINAAPAAQQATFKLCYGF